MRGCVDGGLWGWGFFASGGGLFSPVRVVNAKFVSADRVAGFERIGANAFFFALNAELGVNTDVTSVRPEDHL